MGDAFILLLLPEGEDAIPFGAADDIRGVAVGPDGAGPEYENVTGTVLHLARRTPLSSRMYPLS